MDQEKKLTVDNVKFLIRTVAMHLRADKAHWDGKQAVGLHMGSGLGSFEPTMGCSRNLQARESKFEDTSVATG